MNNIVKLTLKIVSILFVVMLLIISVIKMKINHETSKMKPIATSKITNEIIAIKDNFVNMYLIKNGTSYIAIDSGNDSNIIANELKKLNIFPDSVKVVLLTHTDSDHVAGLSLFKNATLYFSKEEVNMLNGTEQKIMWHNNSISRSNYHLLNDYQIFTKGLVKIKCILTKGHTSGSMCYLIDDSYLFTGDILTLQKNKIGQSVTFFDLNHDLATKSISKITHLTDIQYLFTSHWGISKDYKMAVKHWKK